MTIGENIRAFRKKRGLSQRELGSKIGTGMSQQQLAQYEKGIRIPKADTLQLIADALETSVQSILPSGKYTAELDWIPCEKELPEDRIEFYFVTIDRYDFYRQKTNRTVDICRWDYDRRSTKRGYHWCTTDNVIAWAPLPRPYQPKEDNNEI